MSDIIDHIKSHCRDGLLFPVDPWVPGDPIVRGLYVSAEIYSMLEGEHKNVLQEQQWESARAIMDNYVSGRIMSVGDKDKKRPMSLLTPADDGVWSMRASDPKPGIRILGYFAEKDLFIALTWEERLTLGMKFSFAWRRLIKSCKAEWRKLFYPYQPIQGGNYDEYISNIITN